LGGPFSAAIHSFFSQITPIRGINQLDSIT
jgi:hypothetical protein